MEYFDKPGYESLLESASKYATDEPDQMRFKVDLSDWKYADIPAGGFVGDMTVADLIESAHLFPELLVEFRSPKRWEKEGEKTKGLWNPDRKKIVIYFHPPDAPVEFVQRGLITFPANLHRLRDTIAHELVHFAQYLVTTAKTFAENPITSTPFGTPPKKHKPKGVTPEGSRSYQYQGYHVYNPPVPHPLREMEFYPRLLGDALMLQGALKLIPKEERMKAFKTFVAAAPEYFLTLTDGRKFLVSPFHTLEALKPKTKKYRIAVKAVYDFVKDLL